MFDAYVYPRIEPQLNSFAKMIRPLNLSATTLTLIGFVFGLLAFISLLVGNYVNALMFILLNRFMDGLDGAVAREREQRGEPGGVTDFGAYLDIVTDFIFYSGVVFFFALGRNDMHDMIAALWVIFSYVGTCATFLTYAIFAERHGMPHDVNLNEWAKSKGFFYLGGLAEGTETIIYMVIICLFQPLFMPMSWFFGVLCWMTTISRVWAAFDTFGRIAPAKPKAAPKKAAPKKKAPAKKKATTTKKKST